MVEGKDQIVIELQVPTHLHPLESAAQDFLLRLEDLCRNSDLANTRGVLLLQSDDCVTASSGWTNELRDQLLLDELAQRCLRLRRVCALIRQSSKLWMYAAAGSTYGGFFEIALACHKRFWFDSTASGGFPEIESGSFPPGGSIEHIFESQGLEAADWAKQPYFGIERALERDWADFVGDARDWQNYARGWLTNALKNHAPTQQSRQTPNHTSELPMAPSSPLQKSYTWGGDHGFSDKLFDAWDAAWKVIRSKSRDRSLSERDILLAYFAARHYLSAAYSVWSKRDSWKAAHRVPTYPQTTASDRIVYVSLIESLVPPARPLARLLREGYIVIFVSESPRLLKGNLELLYGRFERIFATNEADDLWQRGVCWLLSEERPPREKMVIQWTSDERLVIQPGRPQEAKFIRLEGNKGSAASGWCEFVRSNAEEPDASSLALATLMSNGIIYTRPVGEAHLPVSMFVRSIFFEEMLRIATRHVSGLNELLDELRATGWGFASTQAAWDYFLIHREGDITMQPQDLAIGKRGLASFAWQIGHWRSALNYVAQHKTKTERMSSQELSLHFAIFCGILAKLILHHGYVSNDFAADTIVKSCLGFPPFHGTPAALLELHGDSRVIYYCQRHWPELVEEVISANA